MQGFEYKQEDRGIRVLEKMNEDCDASSNPLFVS
jgi:hypothetical protein